MIASLLQTDKAVLPGQEHSSQVVMQKLEQLTFEKVMATSFLYLVEHTNC